MPRSTLVAVLMAALMAAGCAQPESATDGVPGPAVTPVDTVPGNLPPLASLQATPGSGRLPLEVVVSFGARDPEGDDVSWTLDFGDDTPQAKGDEVPATVKHTFTRSGAFRITLSVSDGQESSIATVTVRASATQTTTGPPATATSSPTQAPPPTSTGTSTTSAPSSTSATTTTSSTTTTTSDTATTTSDTTTTTSDTTTTTSDTSTTTSETTTTTSDTSTTSESDTGTPPPSNETSGG